MSATMNVMELGSGARILRLSGRIDAGSAEQLHARLGELPLALGDRLSVDLAEVELLDSMGMGVIGRLIRNASTKGAHIALCAAPEAVRRTLEIAQFHRVVDILVDHESAALWLAHLADGESCDA